MSPAPRNMTRAVTGGVLMMMVAAVVAATLGTRDIVRDQERQLLRQRTDELALAINAAAQATGAQLAELAAFARLLPNPAQGFLEAAHVVPSGTARLRALLDQQRTGSFKVLAAVGTGMSAGQEIDDPTIAAGAAAARRATSFVLTPLEKVGTRKLANIIQVAGAPPGEVVLEQDVISPQPTNQNTSGPYSELDVALYDGTKPLASQLTIANAPLSGFHHNRVKEITHLGSSEFLLIAAARSTLVGGVALDAPWIILGLGLLLTAVLGLVFDASQRRRELAMELVEQRTAQLNESLETLRRTQDQLVQSERLAAIGQLASAVGHELRNPLAVLTNALYLLRRATEPSGDPRVGQHLSTAEREVSAATLIVSDLLEFSRGREPILSDVDVGDLVEEALSVAPHPEGVEVDWSPPPSAVWARADRDQLRQVVLNLITNAYDAMPGGGSLRIRAEADGQGLVELEVADSGTGMDEQTRGRVFEPFFTTKARGVGLGLAVTHRIITAHHGAVLVESEPGRGTRFRIRLPAADAR